jgi:cytochrome c oxidase subunit 3
MSASPAASSGKYFVPSPSHWPLVGSAALLTLAFGAVGSMNSLPWGLPVLGAGFVILLIMLFGWFGTVIRESEGRLYGKNVDTSFRWSMSWFIFSEVMFLRHSSAPWAMPACTRCRTSAAWTQRCSGPISRVPGPPPARSSRKCSPMGAWGIPAINTALLLTSGITLTIAHHALIAGNRSKLILWLAATIVLGAVFLTLQIYEYMHAYSELNLKLTTGIFGSTFFMLTGFHGFHVTVGAIMLAVILVRAIRGHFDAEHHFAFEAAAWCWHFVDVVWLGLFVIVYML